MGLWLNEHLPFVLLSVIANAFMKTSADQEREICVSKQGLLLNPPSVRTPYFPCQRLCQLHRRPHSFELSVQTTLANQRCALPTPSLYKDMAHSVA